MKHQATAHALEKQAISPNVDPNDGRGKRSVNNVLVSALRAGVKAPTALIGARAAASIQPTRRHAKPLVPARQRG